MAAEVPRAHTTPTHPCTRRVMLDTVRASTAGAGGGGTLSALPSMCRRLLVREQRDRGGPPPGVAGPACSAVATAVSAASPASHDTAGSALSAVARAAAEASVRCRAARAAATNTAGAQGPGCRAAAALSTQ